MNDRTKKYLADILIAIELIDEFCSDVPDFDSYAADRKTTSAVERQLAIIGEAVNKVKHHSPELLLQNAKKIIDFRNRIVHAYDSIDDSIVWAIIQTHLPQLKIEVSELLENRNPFG